jgi:hypothetical protein
MQFNTLYFLDVRSVPVSDRWISLVLMTYSKVANHPQRTLAYSEDV